MKKFLKKITLTQIALLAILILSLAWAYLHFSNGKEASTTTINFPLADALWWEVVNPIKRNSLSTQVNKDQKAPSPLPSKTKPQALSLRVERVFSNNIDDTSTNFTKDNNELRWQITSPINERAYGAEVEANFRNALSLLSVKDLGSTNALSAKEKAHLASDKATRVSFGYREKNQEISVVNVFVVRAVEQANSYVIAVGDRLHLSPEPFVLSFMKTPEDLVERDFLLIEPRIIDFVVSMQSEKGMPAFVAIRQNFNFSAIEVEKGTTTINPMVLIKKGKQKKHNKTDQQNPTQKRDGKTTDIDRFVQAVGFLSASKAVLDLDKRQKILTTAHLQRVLHIVTKSEVRQRQIVLGIFTYLGEAYAIAQTIVDHSLIAVSQKAVSQNKKPAMKKPLSQFSLPQIVDPQQTFAKSRLYAIAEADLLNLSRELKDF